MNRKKIALIASILMATLAAGVYAGLQLSNTLTASWNVVSTEEELYLSWNPSLDGSNFVRGAWYGDYGARLQNTGTATYHVLIYFTIDAGAGLPTDCIKIQYHDGTDWYNLPMAGWGSSQVSGSFGPSDGFDCTPGWDVTTPFRAMFDGDAPITWYTVTIWVTEYP